jgi:hypothetical protein
MADVNTAEVEAQVDAAFVGATLNNDTPPAPPAKVAEQPVETPAEPEAPKEATPPAEKPQYVRLTKQEWDNTKAAAGKVSSLESQVAKLMGSLPSAEKIVQQVLESVRSQTPAGEAVKLTAEDLAELKEDFPELTEKLLVGIGRAFERANVKGTGTVQSPAPPVDVEKTVQQALIDRDIKTLTRAYPDWDKIVGRPPTPDAPPDENAPFRIWLKTQPAEYQKEIRESRSPLDVKEAIDKWRAETASAAPSAKPDRAAARRAVLADAVTPRADGNPPPLNPPLSADEAFASGFKAMKRH